jgi:hypothetical protein
VASDAAGVLAATIREARLLGLGWATIELDRAAVELGRLLPGELVGDGTARREAPGPTWQDAPRDTILGASARRSAWPGAPGSIVLLEPDTEGRLAATLARFGEGLAALYLDLDEHATEAIDATVGRAGPASSATTAAVATAAVAEASSLLSARATGPFGQQRLVLGARRWGPHVLIVEQVDVRPRRRPTALPR